MKEVFDMREMISGKEILPREEVMEILSIFSISC